MVTPSYFNSSACRDELRKFLKAEEKLGRKDLILTIYYIQCPALEEAEVRGADDLAKAIGERQRWDWRELRHYSFRHRKAIEALAREIDTVRRRVTAKRPRRPIRVEAPFRWTNSRLGCPLSRSSRAMSV
jgi:hypothetical protein